MPNYVSLLSLTQIFLGFAVHCLLGALAVAEDRVLISSSRLVFGAEGDFSASVRAGDFDGDGDQDLVIANGRHWPQQNYILLNDGKARFSVVRPLGADQSTSYAAEPIDVDGDGDLDIVTGNAMAPCHLFLNNGMAQFTRGNPLSAISSVRSLAVADVDGDGHPDVIATSRGMQNLAHLNDGQGHLNQIVRFGEVDDSTIDVAIADLNEDGFNDLILANRDAQKNQILSQSPSLHFSARSLGSDAEQSRAIAVADMDGDGNLDCLIGNIGSPNRIHFGDGTGGFNRETTFGASGRQTYAIAIGDLNRDGCPDVITGVVAGQNVAYLNLGDGKEFRELPFGDSLAATYGLCVADFNGDDFADVAVANSGSRNRVFLNRPRSLNEKPLPIGTQQSPSQSILRDGIKSPLSKTHANNGKDPLMFSADWPQFRGSGHVGVSEGYPLAEQWNADRQDEVEDRRIVWRVNLPGLSHSSPVVVGHRLLTCTAVALEGEAPLKVGRSGAADAADDNGPQQWKVLCFDKTTGEVLWERTCHHGEPRVTRHAKATHANTTLTVVDDRIYAFFGSEGLYCLDMDGTILWQRDLGVINISKYGIGWGYASSPAIFAGKLVLVCDDPSEPFLIALDSSNGEEVWRVSREGETERNWSTPFILKDAKSEDAQVIVNGWPSVISYNLRDGSERWRIQGGGDNPVPTPFAIDDRIYITSAHGSEAPIHVVKADAKGDLTDQRVDAPNQSFYWSLDRGGAYMSTPVVYDDLLYLGNSNGVLRCFHAITGQKIYEERLGSGASVIASLVAGDGKIYCVSENAIVYVVKAGEQYELLAENPMGSPLYASPAISEGVIYFRTTTELIAIQ